MEAQSIPMQLDSGSETSIIPVNLWEQLGKPRLHPTTILLRQFDGSPIKTMGQFEALIEMDNKFAIGNVVSV